MKKRYVWIYVLPVLMLTTTLSFGVLGAKSAMYAQKMNAELAKMDWKMDAVQVWDDARPFYNKYTDLIEIEIEWEGDRIPQYFSSNPVLISVEESLEDYFQSGNEYQDGELDYFPNSTQEETDIMMSSSGEQLGTVEIKQIDDWSDKYVCGMIDQETYGVLDYSGNVLLESEDYIFDYLYDDVFCKRPWNGKGSNTKVFNLTTGKVLCELDGDWLVSMNATGYDAECYYGNNRETIYFDKDFNELTRIENGTVWMGAREQEFYWQTEENGKIKLLDKKLQVKAEYGDELLSFTEFSEGKGLLYYKNKLVCIDENLNVIFEKKAHIPPRYADASRYEKNSLVRGLNVEGFNDGLAVFTLDGCRYGVLDKEGNVLIEPVFKGIDTLTVMKNQHVAVFYEQEFRIGELNAEMGGGQGE